MVFITSYEYDYVTMNLHLWASEVSDFAKKRGVKVAHFHDKHKSKATEKNLISYLSKKKPKFVFLNGHGTRTSINGHKNKEILSVGKNESLLKGKIIYAVACDCGAELGNSIISNGGAKAFIGYKGKFCMPLNEGRECTPLKNHLVEAIKETSNSIPKAIIKGKTITESINIAKREGFKWIKSLQREPSEKSITLLWVLYHNMSCLVAQGDLNHSVLY